jgi:para-nitrobenzyl esterase
MNSKSLFSKAALIAICAVAIAQSAGAQLKEPLKVSGGSVQGVSGKDVSITAFKGIPYAAPPVGKLRWREPQPVVAWDGVLKADRFGKSCIQKEVYERKPWTHEFMSHNDISEDCLYLNVWTPARTASEKLPVYMFIYGGGNVEGSGAVAVYDGEGLAKKGVIVVTPNYRLGILGTFVHPELTAESPSHSSGNYSLLDLVAALKWIKENIAQFGGDPEKVTIGGQSAGSGHTFNLTVTPLAKGLFRGAINESGINGSVITGGATQTTQPLAEAEKVGVEFAKAKGASSLAELRRLSWQEITDPIPPSSPGGQAPTFRFGNVIDGFVFPMSPHDTYAAGKQNDVPTIIGYNRNDNTGPAPHPDVSLAEYKKQAQERYASTADEFLKLYPASTDDDAKNAYTHATWDLVRSGPYYYSLWRAKNAKTKVFTYFWDHTLPGPDADKYGAFHTSEVPYVLNSISKSDRPFTDADRKIADTMSTYWANFIKTGDPNGAGLAHWPSTSEAPGMTMELGNKFEPISITGDKTKQEFFAKYWNSPHPLAR